MKKYVIIVLLVLFIGSSFAYAADFGAGASLGGSLSFVSTSSDSSWDKAPRYGLTVGVYGDYPLYAIEDMVDLAVQPGLFYMFKGFRLKNDSQTFKFNSDYLEVPILVKAEFSMVDLPVEPYALLGPAVGISVIKKSGLYDTDGDLVEGTETTGDDLNIKNLDFGLVIGGGVNVNEEISVDLRFNIGLANIIEDGDADNYMRNRSISLMASYGLM